MAGSCLIQILPQINLNLECFEGLQTCLDETEQKLKFTTCFTTYGQKKIIIANIYAPNKSNPAFFIPILDKVQKIEADYKIIGGDFNTVLNPLLDKKSRIISNKTSKEAELINSFLKNNSWSDVWRLLHPEEKQFTWNRRNPFTMSRLDFFLMPYENINSVSECCIYPGLNSDHSFVTLQIEFLDSFKGRGFWKMNNAFLNNLEYVEEINKIIELGEFRYSELDPGLKLEMIKLDVTEFSILFSKQQASWQKAKIQNFMKKIKSLEISLHKFRLRESNYLNPEYK